MKVYRFLCTLGLLLVAVGSTHTQALYRKNPQASQTMTQQERKAYELRRQGESTQREREVLRRFPNFKTLDAALSNPEGWAHQFISTYAMPDLERQYTGAQIQQWVAHLANFLKNIRSDINNGILSRDLLKTRAGALTKQLQQIAPRLKQAFQTIIFDPLNSRAELAAERKETREGAAIATWLEELEAMAESLAGAKESENAAFAAKIWEQLDAEREAKAAHRKEMERMTQLLNEESAQKRAAQEAAARAKEAQEAAALANQMLQEKQAAELKAKQEKQQEAEQKAAQEAAERAQREKEKAEQEAQAAAAQQREEERLAQQKAAEAKAAADKVAQAEQEAKAAAEKLAKSVEAAMATAEWVEPEAISLQAARAAEQRASEKRLAERYPLLKATVEAYLKAVPGDEAAESVKVLRAQISFPSPDLGDVINALKNVWSVLTGFNVSKAPDYDILAEEVIGELGSRTRQAPVTMHVPRDISPAGQSMAGAPRARRQ